MARRLDARLMLIASSQFNFVYGDQLHYPYSIATLLSQVRREVPGVELLPTLVHRQARYDPDGPAPDVFLGSCYVWNWYVTQRVAAEVKRRWPRCRVVLGGPQVPDRPDRTWWLQHPYVDALVHGEGELSLVELLLRVGLPDGCSDARGSAPPRERIADLSVLRSPYLDGTMDALAPTLPDGLRWIAAWETTRGCPYQCTFCDWGSATYTKLRQFPMERLVGEAEWFGERGLPYIDMCDANFGILPRDLDIAALLANVAKRFGAPGTVRQSWAKNSSQKVIAVAKKLQKGGQLTAVGLAVESLDQRTLQTIKRKNLPAESLAALSAAFAAEGLPTYTEVIRGLPGETLTTFRAGLEQLVDDTQIGAIYVYNCSVLPNAPMADPAYRQAHRIRTVSSPIYLAHSSGEELDGFAPESEELVVETGTMPAADMLEAHMLSWWVLAGHSLHLFDVAIAELRRRSGCTFFEACHALQRVARGALCDELLRVRKHAERGLAGRGWGDVAGGRFGSVLWPIEEASWLRLMDRPRRLKSELAYALTEAGWALPSMEEIRPEEAADIAARQVAGLAARPLHESRAAWARRVMWHGRRRGAFRLTKRVFP